MPGEQWCAVAGAIAMMNRIPVAIGGRLFIFTFLFSKAVSKLLRRFRPGA
jgi:hypothetical protein